MRKTLLLSVAFAGLAFGPAFAQSANTHYPPAPNSGASMPQSPNSLPQGAETHSHDMAGDNVSGTVHHHHHHHVVKKPGDQSMNEPQDSGRAVGTGQSGPASTQASNLNGRTTHSEIAPHLPNPVDSDTAGARTYLHAADQALAGRKTGAAQEALERAETRLLSRASLTSTDPQNDPSVKAVSQARRNLANGDTHSARQAIQQAMAESQRQPGQQMGQQMGDNAGNTATGGNSGMGVGAGTAGLGAGAGTTSGMTNSAVPGGR